MNQRPLGRRRLPARAVFVFVALGAAIALCAGACATRAAEPYEAASSQAASLVQVDGVVACPVDGTPAPPGCKCTFAGVRVPGPPCNPCACPAGYSFAAASDGNGGGYCSQDPADAPHYCVGTNDPCTLTQDGSTCPTVPKVVACEARPRKAACVNECAQGGVRLGALMNPDISGKGLPQSIDELQSALGEAGGAPLTFVVKSTSFVGAAAAFEQEIGGDLAPDRGRIPMIDLKCQPDDANGYDAGPGGPALDAVIYQLAQTYGSYGAADGGAPQPVYVRYCYEMNGAAESYPGTPAQFQQEWIHIHDQLMCDQYAMPSHTSNVVWVFNSTDNADAGSPYYPGDAYVDYAGFDTFHATSGGLSAAIGPAYAGYGWINKPFIVGATGAVGADQASYLNAAAASTLAQSFPKIVAIDYFDAPNQFCPSSDAGVCSDYSFTGGVNGGFSAFIAFAQAIPAAYR